MKRKLALLIAITMCIFTMVGCGKGIKVPDEYNYDDLSKYIELGNYEGNEYEMDDLDVSREDIDDEIKDALEAAKTSKKLTSGVATEDCTANIDYSGSIDGVKFDGGTAEGYDLDLDNSTFIDGFAEGILGHSVGENFDIHVTFPKDYGNDLGGKEAVFNITLNYLSKDVLPEYNDEFVKNNTEFKNTADYEADIEKRLKDQKKIEAEAEARSEVFDEILDNSKVLEYPEKELADRKEKLAKQSDDSVTDAELEEDAKMTVKIELVLHQIAQLEGIKITDKDYQEYVDQLLSDAGFTEDSFKQQNGITIAAYAEESNLFTTLLYQTVMDKVMEYSKAL